MNLKLLYILFFSILALVSCENEKINKEYEVDFSEGEYYCFIDTLIQENNKYHLIVDFVNYLTGEKAYNEAMKNGDYFINGNDTIADITDDYYIANNNPKLRKFQFFEQVKINTYYAEKGRKTVISKENFIDSIKSLNDIYGLFYIKYNEGKIISIDETFIP